MRRKQRGDGAHDFYKILGKELRSRNRFFLPEPLRKTVDEYIEWHIKNYSKNINSGAEYKRARVNGVDQVEPYKYEDMGPPPNDLVGPGRINPEGISYLYLADLAETAISEVRPHKGVVVSVATFKLEKNIKIVSLHDDGFSGGHDMFNDVQAAFKGIMHSMYINALYFSAPVHSLDKLAYLPSQYLAEMFKLNNVDGVEYKSSMHDDGINLAIFNPKNARCIQVEQYVVDKVKYNVTPFDESTQQAIESPRILDMSNVIF